MKDNKKIKVCHLTSAHPAKDGRIFYKECTSLAKAGYDVTLVAAGADDEECNGVKIVGVPVKKTGRFNRMLNVGRDVYKKALDVDADIYHLHDPELLSHAKGLIKHGKKVIFDSHEDFPADITNKHYLPKVLRKFIGYLYGCYEANICRRLNGVISVTPHIVERFKKINANTVMVTNFPIIKDSNISSFNQDDINKVSYVGPINNAWSVKRLIDCVGNEQGKYKLVMAGVADSDYLDDLKCSTGWKFTDFKGKVKPSVVQDIYSGSVCGFALLQPSPNSHGKLGTIGNTKLFEIMFAGIPVICTNFVLWQQIIEGHNAGICVDPNNEEEILTALRKISGDSELAKRMGENGRRAVITKFNWESQEKELIKFYDNL